MTLQSARQSALRMLRDSKKYDSLYIVWSVEEDDEPGHHYQVCSDRELESFFLGCEPVDCVTRGDAGDIERSQCRFQRGSVRRG